MNVFFLDLDPVQAAHLHCRVHMRKMITEYAQMLSTAHHVIDGDDARSGLMKVTHKNHPSCIWTREAHNHYRWVLTCAIELCALYTEDSGKIHKSHEVLLKLLTPPQGMDVQDEDFTPPPVVTDVNLYPEKYKAIGQKYGTVEAYRAYVTDKLDSWQRRASPMDVSWVRQTPDWYLRPPEYKVTF